MKRHLTHKKDAYVLLITIVITLVLALTVATMLTVIYRYAGTINKNLEELRQIVFNS